MPAKGTPKCDNHPYSQHVQEQMMFCFPGGKGTVLPSLHKVYWLFRYKSKTNTNTYILSHWKLFPDSSGEDSWSLTTSWLWFSCKIPEPARHMCWPLCASPFTWHGVITMTYVHGAFRKLKVLIHERARTTSQWAYRELTQRRWENEGGGIFYPPRKVQKAVTANEGKMSPETDYPLRWTEPNMPRPVFDPE